MATVEELDRAIKLKEIDALIAQREQEQGGLGRAAMIGAQGVGRGLADLVGGIPDLINLPINTAIGGVNYALDTDIPTLPSASESIANLASGAAKSFGLPIVAHDDMSMGEKLAYGADRYGTSFGVGGALPNAGRATGLIDEATPVLGQLFQRMLPARDAAPIATAVDDVAMGVGAGLGATAVDEAVPDDAHPIVRMLSDLIGTTVGAVGGRGAVGVGRTVGGATDASVRRLTLGPAELADPETGFRSSNTALDKAAQVAQDAAVDPKGASKVIGERVADIRAHNEPLPTTGILSDDEGLIALEQAGRIPAPVKFIANDRRVRTRAAQDLHDMMPADAADLDRDGLIQYARQATDEAGSIVSGQRNTAQQGVDVAQQRLDDVTARRQQIEGREGDIVAPVAAQRGRTGEASAQLDRALVDETLRPMTTEKNARFDAIDPDGNVAVPNGGGIQTLAREIEQEVGRLTPENLAVPTEFTERLRRLAAAEDAARISPDADLDLHQQMGLANERGLATAEATGVEPPAPLSTREVQEIRPHLKNMQEKARQTGNFQLADNIGRLRSEINRGIDDLAETDPNAASAQSYYRDEYMSRFGGGKGKELRDAINKDDLSRTKTPPSKTAEKFLFKGNGSREAAADLNRILTDTPSENAGLQAAHDYLAASLARTVNPDGKANAALVRKWIDDHRDVLDEFPEIGDEFRAFHRALVSNKAEGTRLADEMLKRTKDLRDAKAGAAEVEKRIGKNALSILVDAEPQKAVAGVFQSKDPQKAMRDINKQLGKNPKARLAWNAAVVDYLEQKLGTSDISSTVRGADAIEKRDPISFAKAHNFFKKNNHVLAEAFDDPLKMQALQRIHKQLEPLARLGQRATVRSDTAENIEKLLDPVEVVMRWKYGHLQTGGIMKSIRKTLATVPGLSEKDAVSSLIFRMQFEPELAQHLLNRPTAKVPLAKWDKKLKALLVGASASREASGEDQ